MTVEEQIELLLARIDAAMDLIDALEAGYDRWVDVEDDKVVRDAWDRLKALEERDI